MRIHHVRPRFKSNVENVLIYVASLVAQHGCKTRAQFREMMRKKLREFPGNANKTDKTLDNWRTEISALFGLYYEKDDQVVSSMIAKDLYESQDLTKFFRYFLYNFQYPGGHIKPHENEILIREKVLFNPARYFLRVIKALHEKKSGAGYLTKGEACHLIFNNKEATTDPRFLNVTKIASQILANRTALFNYDLTGDVIRYAGDILDYMVLANLLKDFAGKFYLNRSEQRAIDRFLVEDKYFKMTLNDLDDHAELEERWIKFCYADVGSRALDSNVLAFIGVNESEFKELEKRTQYIQEATTPEKGTRTKDIGDYGEHVVFGHECQYLRSNSREDLLRWVKCIPNHFAVGYDIQSVDLKEVKKYIEVKSTISSKRLTVNKFHLTKNELSSASTLKENYFIYRLQIIKGDKGEEDTILKLWILRDPIRLYKEDKIEIDLATGDVSLSRYFGEEVAVLRWGA